MCARLQTKEVFVIQFQVRLDGTTFNCVHLTDSSTSLKLVSAQGHAEVAERLLLKPLFSFVRFGDKVLCDGENQTLASYVGAPQHGWNDKDFVLRTISLSGKLLERASATLRADHEAASES